MNKHLRNFLAFWGLAENQKSIDYQKWHAEQKHKLEIGDEIKPPWIVFPNSEPFGWNQGHQEYWKANVWKPFWDNLSENDRKKYLTRWTPPNKNRQDFMTIWGNN